MHAENVSLETIAQQVGTPVYVYSANAIRHNYKAFADAFTDILPANKQPLICYACKANSNIAVLNLLAKMGSGLDIVSEGELKRGLKAGIPANKIVASGVGKTAQEITAYLKAGIHQINVESLPELITINDIASSLNIDAPVSLRINPDVDAKTHEKITTGKSENKFGIDFNSLIYLIDNNKEYRNLNIMGLSIHIGSQLIDLSPYKEAFTKLAGTISSLKERGFHPKRLDLGGGVGIVYQNESTPCLNSYAKLIRDYIAPLDTEIIIEPGRAIVGNAGILLSEIIYVKEGENRKFQIIDAAMNDLMRPSLYDSWHDILPVSDPAEKELSSYDIVGPICETGDTFAKQRPFPHVQNGDLVAIMSSGAYGAVMAGTYNSRALSPEVLVDGDRFVVIRERMNVESFMEKETIPPWQ